MRRFLFIFLAMALAPAAAAQTGLDVATYMDMERAGSPQLSPDGTQIIYTRSYIDKINDSWASELWIMDSDGSRKRFLTKGSSPRWSPDGSRIAYMTQGEPKGQQLFVRWMDAEGATSQITRVPQTPSSFKWSPDGNHLAFVMLVPEKETWSIPMPAAPAGANWTAPPRMVTKTHYRQDRRGFMAEGFTHLFVVPAEGGTPRQLTEGSWNVGARFSGLSTGAGLDWTPDGRHIVFDGLMDEAPELDGFRQSYLYKVDVATKEVDQIIEQKGGWGNPVISPDGSMIAFTGHDKLEQTYHVSDLHVVNIDGSDMRNLTRSFDRDAGGLNWTSDSRSIYFTAGNEGSQNIHRASLRGRVSDVTSGVHMLAITSMGPNKRLPAWPCPSISLWTWSPSTWAAATLPN